MKKFLRLLTFLFMLVPVVAKAQILEPVQWTVETEKLNKNEYNIVFKAEIEDGWHLYSQNTPFGGPMPLYFEFIDTLGIERKGGVEEPKAIVHYSEIFEIDEHFFEKEAVFTQRVKLLDDAATVTGVITGQTCKESCIQLEYEFEVQLGETAVVKDATEKAGGESLLALIIEAIIWGFAALMTPCVFPMIPMTVSFFLHGDESKAVGRFKAIMYYVFIVGLYTLPIAAIIMITWIFGGDSVTADIFNWISTSWVTNILFFVVFMVFAASFFGAFELTLPNSWVNKTDSKTSTSKGLGGVFFMALTLVLVSFACTGPIVGTVLIKSTSGEVWTPIITMMVFAMAFGLPFALCALFPSLLQNMPKSGGWLNSVKVVLGFVEIALGFKFLSVADQTYHWGLLDREVYLAIWIVTFTLLGLYLLGKIKFAHDSDVPHLSVLRLVLAIVVFTFVVYMIPGMWGAPLKALSGYLPPQQTMDFDLKRINQENSDKVIQYVDAKMTNLSVQTEQVDKKVSSVLCEAPKYADFLHLPHGLKGYFDYEQGLACAKAQNKPIYIDFTGHGCVNCREMEANVWSDPRVLEMLRDEYVIIALYVDDKTTLPEDEWMVNSKGKKKKTSIGSKNSAFQISKFDANAQPYYCLMGHNGELLVEPRSYNLDKDAFVDFLKKGIENFNNGVSIRNIYE